MLEPFPGLQFLVVRVHAPGWGKHCLMPSLLPRSVRVPCARVLKDTAAHCPLTPVRSRMVTVIQAPDTRYQQHWGAQRT